MRRARLVAITAAAAIAMAGCQSTRGTGSQAPTPSPSPPATETTPAQATASTGPTAAVPRSLPGLGEVEIVRPGSVAARVDGDAFELTLTRQALWFMHEQGVLVHRLVEGDFEITATVSTHRASDPTLGLRGEGIVELGGLMARAPDAPLENYVFIVVGNDPDGRSVEVKSTRDGDSTFDGPAWDRDVADLRLCRTGSTFTAWKRHSGTREAWTLAGSWERPDLPDRLQVGANIYSSGAPDLVVRFEDVDVEAPTSGGGCLP